MHIWRKGVCLLAMFACMVAGAAAEGASVPQAFSAAVKENHPAPFYAISEEAFDDAVATPSSRWNAIAQRADDAGSACARGYRRGVREGA